MGRIFKICGNFKKNGKWNTPDPYFTGEIILENNDVFYGYLTEGKEAKYLVGVITEDKKEITDAQFYIMSNDHTVSPVFCDTKGEGGKLAGQWYEMKYHLDNKQPYTFSSESAARVIFEKESYSKKAENRIEGKFSNLNQNTAMNGRIIRSVLEFS